VGLVSLASDMLEQEKKSIGANGGKLQSMSGF
jgi:hypothetical protein